MNRQSDRGDNRWAETDIQLAVLSRSGKHPICEVQLAEPES